jgi:hypothetical protein
MRWYVLYRHRGTAMMARAADERDAVEQAAKLAKDGKLIDEIGYLDGKRRKVLKRGPVLTQPRERGSRTSR